MKRPKTPALPSRKFRLCDWEENGYHDSYFYMAYWDEATSSVKKMETGSTAYGGGVPDSDFLMPDFEIVEKAIAWLADVIFEQIKEAEYRDVYEPAHVQRGDWLVLLRPVKCKGIEYPAGHKAEVSWSGNFGQFFRKGYNRPGRDNTRVGLRGAMPADPILYAPLSACRRAKDPMPDDELRERANKLAEHCHFKRAVSTHGGWVSRNWALEVWERAARDKPVRFAETAHFG